MPNNLPSITFQSITFSDGTTIDLDPTDIVVFVGPNNAGKSLALRELEGRISRNPQPIVIKSTQLCRTGTQEDLEVFLRTHAQVKVVRHERQYSGYGFSVAPNSIANWPNDTSPFCSLFCMRVATETRITASNSAQTIDFLNQPASHPIHMLFWDDKLEERISSYFRSAFGEDLILFRLGGESIPLFVGQEPNPRPKEDRLSRPYIQLLRNSTVPLQNQGDGMRSFGSVILHLLAPLTPTILLLDEPEAFLHPPQARLLGEIIAMEKSSRSQLFIATHCSDVLHGLINAAPGHLQVLRIQREGNVNRIKELDKELVKEISTNPLMKYSSVVSGVFHERVVICESDADCMFYSSILDLPKVHGERQPDVLFVHASGKDRIAVLAKALTALDVPVDVIIDIDILQGDTVFQRTVEAPNGDWAAISPLVKEIRAAIEQQKPSLSIDEIKATIREILDATPLTNNPSNEMSTRIDSIFRNSSRWGIVKTGGEAALPRGQITERFHELQRHCKQMGLWIVPVGELEGFCRSVGNHGPGWVQQVIEQKDLATDGELEYARRFIHEIWMSR